MAKLILKQKKYKKYVHTAVAFGISKYTSPLRRTALELFDYFCIFFGKNELNMMHSGDENDQFVQLTGSIEPNRTSHKKTYTNKTSKSSSTVHRDKI